MTKIENDIVIQLVDRVSRVETEVKNLSIQVIANSTIVAANSTVVSNLITAQAKENGIKYGIKSEKENTEKKKMSGWQKATIIISGIIGISVVISAWILKFI